jgi:hypothetical protein
MTALSGIGKTVLLLLMLHHADSATACTLGASIIAVDLIICKIPGHQNFRIQDSNAFLSSSLSLSFGVMVWLFPLS